MTALLEVRERIKQFYSRFEIYILPVVKFLVAFIVLQVINSKMSYMAKIDRLPVVLIAALLCSFLPNGCIVFFAAVFSLLHTYAMAKEAALIVLCLYLILFLLVFRFSPKESLLVVLTPILFVMKIPYVVPIAAGLLLTPASIVSACSGVVVYYALSAVLGSYSNLMTMGEDTLGKVRYLVDALVGSKTTVVLCAAFAFTILGVYLLRRLSVDYAWSIAMGAGAVLNIVVILVGDYVLDLDISVGGVILGTLLALVIAKIIEFFRFCVDYSRTEKVQFEDDEYYYYVKAVPKMTVAAPTKTVKTINTTRDGRGRDVETEYTGGRRGKGSDGRGRSVTIGSTDMEGYAGDEYGYEGEYAEGDYAADGEYAEGGEYVAEGEYAEGDYAGDGEYAEDGEYEDYEGYEEEYSEDEES